MTTPRSPTVELRNVTKVFAGTRRSPDVCALADLTLTIGDKPRADGRDMGEFVVLLGPSGCGKSTILSLVAGLALPDKGEVFVFGEQVTGPHPFSATVPQAYTCFPWLSAVENVEFGLLLAGKTKKERRPIALEYLDKVLLKDRHDAHPRHLSGGMQQRVAIARTLALKRPIVLMDEPFGALDAQTRADMQQMLLTLWEEEKSTILFVTHDITEALLLADRVVVFSPRPANVIADLDLMVRFPFERPPEIVHSPEFLKLSEELRKLIKTSETSHDAPRSSRSSTPDTTAIPSGGAPTHKPGLVVPFKPPAISPIRPTPPVPAAIAAVPVAPAPDAAPAVAFQGKATPPVLAAVAAVPVAPAPDAAPAVAFQGKATPPVLAAVGAVPVAPAPDAAPAVAFQGRATPPVMAAVVAVPVAPAPDAAPPAGTRVSEPPDSRAEPNKPPGEAKPVTPPSSASASDTPPPAVPVKQKPGRRSAADNRVPRVMPSSLAEEPPLFQAKLGSASGPVGAPPSKAQSNPADADAVPADTASGSPEPDNSTDQAQDLKLKPAWTIPGVRSFVRWVISKFIDGSQSAEQVGGGEGEPVKKPEPGDTK